MRLAKKFLLKGSGAVTGWVSILEGTSNDLGYFTCAADSSGNTYAAGYEEQYATTTSAALLVKLDNMGSVTWQKHYDGPYTAWTGVSVDGSSNTYLTGYDTDSHTIAGKFNSSGSLQWQRDALVYYPEFPSALSSGSDMVVTSANGTIGYLTSFNSSGTINWGVTITPPSGTFLGSVSSNVSIDSSGNIFFSLKRNTTGTPYVIFKFNSSGTVQWQKEVTLSGGFVRIFGCALDSSGNVYFCGRTYDGATSTSYVVKLDTSGAVQWERSLIGAIDLVGMAVSNTGDVYTIGKWPGASYGAIIIKYNSSGTLQWQRGFVDTFYANYDYSRLCLYGNSYRFNYFALDASFAYYAGAIVSLPIDGSLTGTYAGANGDFVYSTTTESAGSVAATFTSITCTVGSNSVTNNTPTDTVGATTYTDTLTPIP